MHLNKRGVALLQVLIVAAVLAGFSAMVLRVVMSRTLLARQNRRTVTAQMLIENCMAEVNYKLASQTPSAKDLNFPNNEDGNKFAEVLLPNCCIQVGSDSSACAGDADTYVCDSGNSGFGVKALFHSVPDGEGKTHCEIEYLIADADNL